MSKSIDQPELIYLAGPYSHKDPKVMEHRELMHSKCAALLLSQGIHVYSPIAETVNIAKHDSVKDTGWEFWRATDLNKLSRCDRMYVMNIGGWEESKGVRGEVKYAIKNNIPIEYIDEHATCRMLATDILEVFGVKDVELLND